MTLSMPRCRLVLAMTLVLIAAAAGPLKRDARAQDALRAAAVVNDEVISILDLLMRVRLAILGAGIEDTPEARNRIARQVLGRLIDERLQQQEAERLDIDVTDSQMDLALESLARQNKMTREQLFDALNQRSIYPSALLDQVRAQLLWQIVVQRSLTPKITIREDEIDEIVARISAKQGELERRVAEITLGVETALQEEEVRQNAARLVEQIRAGASFSGLAREFSQSATANLGGDLGWVKDGELPDNLNRVLAGMQPGQVSDPVRTLTGFTILLLLEQRQSEAVQVDRDKIEEGLKKQRANQLAQRTLWELRRSANVDIRI